MRVCIASLVTIAVLFGCKGDEGQQQPAESESPTTTSAQAGSPVGQAPYDLQFLDTMSKHHQGAVDMARMSEAKIQHPELKKLVAKIPADQQKEIEQMKAWRDQWYPAAAPAENMQMPGMSQSHMDMSHMETMQAGRAYDVMFIDMMIPHHEGAIAMARDALQKAERQEI